MEFGRGGKQYIKLTKSGRAVFEHEWSVIDNTDRRTGTLIATLHPSQGQSNSFYIARSLCDEAVSG